MINTKAKYNIQKHHAGKRGIDWQFTYEEWLAWWGDDIVNRGRNKGQLVMARNGDTGPYHPDNCVKKTCSENASEACLGKPAHNKGKPHSEETKIKMRISSPKRKLTEEQKENNRRLHTGKKRSEETKQKLKDAWARRKQNA